MKKILLLLCLSAATTLTFSANAATLPADTGKAAAAPAAPAPPDPPLVFSGSVDTYYKYDFSGHNNFPTSFANEQNSISIGMIDLALKKTVGKASFVGELSFGPRGQQQSIPNADPGSAFVNTPIGANNYGGSGVAYSSYHIQNLYISYNLTDKFNLTAGYMSTFIGYEVISPVGNFNYSTSYLFTNGPFQNAGFKATYTFSPSVSLMAGVFNDVWNSYQSVQRANTFGAQLMIVPVKNWTAYLNVATGPISGTEFDLTTAYQITPAFKLGLNAATASKTVDGDFDGIALYPQIAVSPAVTFGLRGEYFQYRNGGGNVKSFTFTANIKAGPVTLIPEFRLDSKSSDFLQFGDTTLTPFTDSNGVGTNSASQFVLAAVFAF